MNRFTQPLQSPTNFKPYELPFEQMVQTLGIAEQQNDAARSGVFEILDFEFPYIPTQSNQIAYETIKQDIGEGVDGMLQGNTGDLRGLRGNILNMQRGLKNRATRKDGDIYKLSSDYATYKAWEKTNEEVAKTDPTRYMQYKSKYLKDLEDKGGSLSSSFNGEAVLKTPNWSEKVKSYTADIKADLIKRGNSSISGITLNTWEDIKKYVTPQEIMQVAVGYLGSDPEVMEYFMQDIRNNFRTEEDSQFLKSKTGEDGKIITELNAKNPAVPAIQAAMIAQGFLEHSYTTSSKYDATAYQMYKDEKDKEMMYNSYGISEADSVETIKKSLEIAIESGDPIAIKQAVKSIEGNPYYQEVITELQNHPVIKEKWESNINAQKDANGKTVSFEDFTKALAVSKGDVGNTLKALEGMGYDFQTNSVGTQAAVFGKEVLSSIKSGLAQILIPGGIGTAVGMRFGNITENIFKSVDEKYQSNMEKGMQEVVGFSPTNDKAWNAGVAFYKSNNGANLFLPGGTNLNTYLQTLAKDKKAPVLTNVQIAKDKNLSDGRHQLIATYKYDDGQVGTVLVSEATSFSPLSRVINAKSLSATHRGNDIIATSGDITSMYGAIPANVNKSAKSGDVFVDKVPNSNDSKGKVQLIYHRDNEGLWVVPKVGNDVLLEYKTDPMDTDRLRLNTHQFLVNNKLFKQ